MTTRAGLAGLLAGSIASAALHSLSMVWSDIYLWNWSARPSLHLWVVIIGMVVIFITGGWLAGRWSRSVRPVRRAALGGLAGGLVGAIVFCLWGAAAAAISTLLRIPTRTETQTFPKEKSSRQSFNKPR